MKNFLVVCLFFFTLDIYTQTPFISINQNDDQYLVTEKIIRLESFLNSGKLEELGVPAEYFVTQEIINRNKENNLINIESFIDFNIEIQNINIKDDDAEADVIFSYANQSGERISNSVNILLIKENSWKFSSLGIIADPFLKILKEEPPSIEGYTILQPLINNYTFHRIPVLTPQGYPPIYKLSYGVTESIFNKQLFSSSVLSILN